MVRLIYRLLLLEVILGVLARLIAGCLILAGVAVSPDGFAAIVSVLFVAFIVHYLFIPVTKAR